jgi:hypothetical protein
MSHQIGNSADVAAVRKRQADRQKVQAPPDTPGNWLGWLAGGVTTTPGGVSKSVVHRRPADRWEPSFSRSAK